MNPPTLPEESASYKDRKTGLIVFGVFTALLGSLCALFVPLMFFSQAMAAKSGIPSSQMTVLPAVFIYGLLAVALVWLGIGSMMARRWARALLLIFSWSWLITGVLSLGMMAVMWPQISAQMADAANPTGQPNQPPGWIFILIPMIFLTIFFVIVPAIWVFFYRSRHVKATCEALDPVTRWTDLCPLPVLAACLWLGFSAPMMIVMAGAYHGVIPMFGSFLSGAAGSAIYVFMGLVWGYAAWSLYRLQWSGWWLIVVSVSLFIVSSFLTYSRHDVTELYTLMGYPEAMIAEMQKYNILKGRSMAWLSIVGAVPFLGYFFYLRRYLRAS